MEKVGNLIKSKSERYSNVMKSAKRGKDVKNDS